MQNFYTNIRIVYKYASYLHYQNNPLKLNNMNLIGFANKYFTLWHINVEPQYKTFGNQSFCTGNKITRTYIQNLSTDEDEAKAKFEKMFGTDAPSPDDELKGKRRSFSTYKEVYPADRFGRGKLIGMLIAECEDMDYLCWAASNILGSESLEIAASVLTGKGFVFDEPNSEWTTPEIRDERAAELAERQRLIDFWASFTYGWHFPNKEKVNLKLKCICSDESEGRYGTYFTYDFSDSENRHFFYSGSKELGFEEGQEVEINATVKTAYDLYDRDKKVTKLLRIKV